MQKNVGSSEQALRATAGALLLLAAMSRRKLLALAGFGLLWSAATQYCPINEAAGRNSFEPSSSGQSPAQQKSSSAAAPESDQRPAENAPVKTS